MDMIIALSRMETFELLHRSLEEYKELKRDVLSQKDAVREDMSTYVRNQIRNCVYKNQMGLMEHLERPVLPMSFNMAGDIISIGPFWRI